MLKIDLENHFYILYYFIPQKNFCEELRHPMSKINLENHFYILYCFIPNKNFCEELRHPMLKIDPENHIYILYYFLTQKKIISTYCIISYLDLERIRTFFPKYGLFRNLNCPKFLVFNAFFREFVNSDTSGFLVHELAISRSRIRENEKYRS